MASKFQNRLVGTVILVALGVIILPGLLDGKKKHYEDEFAAIPLVPKPGDEANETDVIPPVSQELPAQPPEGAGALVEQQAASEAAGQAAQQQPQPQQPQQAQPRQQQLQPQQPPQQQPRVVAPPLENKPAPAVRPQPPESKPVEAKPKPVPTPEVKPEAKPKPAPEEKAPVGQAYVVQLGALKNAAKVNEIVALLRLSGYRAYTVPSTPVQGEITRIYVGPDASKQKLQASLAELNAISGLSGQVRAYSAR